MSDIAHFLNATFAALIALYVCIQTGLAIAQVRSAEHAADRLPAAFRSSVPLAVHRKAADYTGETVQADLVNAYLGAIVCVILTFGNGFNALTAGTIALFGAGLISEFTMVFAVLLILTLIDFPLTWWKQFRINERYGYEKERARRWLREKAADTLTGLAVLVPVLLGGLYVFNLMSYAWWVLAAFLSVLWLAWRIFLGPAWTAGHAENVKPLTNAAALQTLTRFLASLNLHNVEICTGPRPAGWRRGNAYFCRRLFGRRRLVVFKQAVENLSAEELTAVVACAAGRLTRWHDPVRFIFFAALSILFWWGFSLLAVWPVFYEALNIEPTLALVHGAVNPGLLLLIAVTIVPVVLYPLVLLVHAFTRLLDFDEDAFAVRTVGAKPFVRALVKLQTDYRNTLTPNRFFSLANHIRPHVTQRMTQAFIDEQKMKRASMAARTALEGDLAGQFSALIAARRKARNARNDRLWQLKALEVAERRALRARAVSFNPIPGTAQQGNR